MQQIVVCKLDTRRRDSQQIEKELLAMSVRERCLEPGYPGAVLDFDNVAVLIQLFWMAFSAPECAKMWAVMGWLRPIRRWLVRYC